MENWRSISIEKLRTRIIVNDTIHSCFKNVKTGEINKTAAKTPAPSSRKRMKKTNKRVHNYD